MYLNQKNDTPLSSFDDLANTFKISRNHLIKLIQFLSANQLILTKRRENGGILISDKSREIRLGDLIHLSEQDDAPIVNCDSKPCIFQSHNCKLKSLFNTAYQTFIESFNHYTPSDVEFKNWSAKFLEY